MDLYEVVITHNSITKRLETLAKSPEEAASKFERHIVCNWCGYPWETPEQLLDGTIDKLENNGRI